ncbi:MAG: hypothetical protein DHS20C14_10310 [Phycisphaeraceae bacterium]|nr:MAG: hypothetical protein DHS20C14_10310 [Phycisphaeraceae bacterium]
MISLGSSVSTCPNAGVGAHTKAPASKSPRSGLAADKRCIDRREKDRNREPPDRGVGPRRALVFPGRVPGPARWATGPRKLAVARPPVKPRALLAQVRLDARVCSGLGGFSQ